MTSSRERGRDAPWGLGVTGVNAAAFFRVLHHAPFVWPERNDGSICLADAM
jgi:hypothetical protein